MRLGSARGLSAALACLGAAGLSVIGSGTADATAGAARVQLGPVADAYVSAAAPRTSYSAGRRLDISARPLRRALLRFEVHNVGGPVTRATLRLRTLKGSRGAFEVHGLLGATAWRQRGLTYRRAPRIGRRIARSGSLSTARWVSLDVTSAVRGNGTVSFGLTTSSRHISFASREARGFAPKLVVESVVPEPAPLSGAPLAPSEPLVLPPTPPSGAEPPAVSGRPWITRILTASPGGWTGSEPFSLAYQWRSCDKAGEACTDIAGAIQPAYTVASADAGQTIHVAVTASNAAGSATSASEPTAVITTAPPSPAAAQPPTISGTPRQDDVLSSSAGTWKGAKPMTFSYQWRRCDVNGGACTDIEAATGSKYSVLPEDVRGTVRVAVTATNEAEAVTSVSKQTRAIVASGEPFAGALWHMDETKGSTMTDSLGSATGKLKGVQIGQPGVLGHGYRFTGSSLISVSSKALNPGAIPFSINAHVNFTQKPSAIVGDYDLVRKGLSATSGGDYKMEIFPGGNAYCYFRGSSGSAEVSGGGNLADGRWHTITCAKQDNKVVLTVDGKTSSSSGKVGSISNSASLLIGGQSGGIDPYSGLMDEVSIDIG
jgi:concanavalin A-like lectin/glucanase superfamily protein